MFVYVKKYYLCAIFIMGVIQFNLIHGGKMIRKVLMFAGSMLAFVMMLSAQSVGISSTVITPDASSMLEIQATNKGLLIPRVALTATNAAGPISSPATSLMVYNTATASSGATAVYPGYYYNAGTPASPNWVRFLAGRDAWLTTGNYGATMGTNFLGTLDAQGLDFRTNGTLRLRIANGDQVLANSLGTEALPFWTFVADPNTGLYSPGADILGFSTNGVERFRMNTTEAVINEQSNDYDFRVETDGQNDMFVIDAGNDRVYFNSTTGASGDLVSVYNSTNWNSSGNPWLINSYNSYTDGGSGFFENSSSSNGYNAMEGTTSYTGTSYTPAGLWGLAIASSGSGVGLKASTNSMSTSSYGLYAKCMYTDNNGYYAGYFSGRVYTTGNYYVASDRKLKTNFSPVEGSLVKLMQLKIYEYDFNKEYSKFISSDQRQVGFIAQDVQQLFPGSDLVSSVSMIANNGAETTRSLASTERLDALAISYSAFVPYIVKAMQEQQQIIEDLKKRIEELEKANNGRK